MTFTFSQTVIQPKKFKNAKFSIEVNLPTPPSEFEMMGTTVFKSFISGKSVTNYTLTGYKFRLLNFNKTIARLRNTYKNMGGYSIDEKVIYESDTKIIEFNLVGPSFIIQRCFKHNGIFYTITVENTMFPPTKQMINPFFYSYKLDDGFCFTRPPDFSDHDLVYILQNEETESNLSSNKVVNQISTNSENSNIKSSNPIVNSDVDINFPSIAGKSNRYALIIGNEDYSSHQSNLSNEINVDFAIHDATIFKQYALNILGIPDENIIYGENVGTVEMNRLIEKINVVIKNAGSNSEIFVYYAGHGFPDAQTKTPYLIPVDCSGTDLKYAVKLSELYSKLTQYQSRRVIVFLDACFSGGARNVGLLAARGVKIKPNEGQLSGNLVVFAASTAEQSALPYKEKGHGLFTYFLLKKLQETKGNVSLDELSEYLKTQVGIKSALVNSIEQNPTISVSPSLQTNWTKMYLND